MSIDGSKDFIVALNCDALVGHWCAVWALVDQYTHAVDGHGSDHTFGPRVDKFSLPCLGVVSGFEANVVVNVNEGEREVALIRGIRAPLV